MTQDNDFDPLFSGEEPIVPSSGFTESVMRAVRAEALEPPPIPFPWKHAIPGLLSAILVAVSYVMALFSNRPEPEAAATLLPYSQSSALNAIVAELMRTDIQMMFMVLVLTFVVARLSMRILSERQ